MARPHPHRLALLLGLLLAAPLAACHHDNGGTDDGTGNTRAARDTAGATAPNGSIDAPAAGDTATTSDNSALSDTSGTAAGTAMDNTAAGSTAGDMSTSGSATPATRTDAQPPTHPEDEAGNPPPP
ncbi:MAG: hypothetical protein ACTHKZ_07680 [Lysobacteraceae bacterium]